MRGVPVEPLPLTREDRTILALERGAVVGHTCKVLLAGSAIDAAMLRHALADRIAGSRSTPSIWMLMSSTGSVHGRSTGRRCA
jgi:hypothetical protein